jgi:hypothetical protein
VDFRGATATALTAVAVLFLREAFIPRHSWSTQRIGHWSGG